MGTFACKSIRSILEKEFPEHGILGEEYGPTNIDRSHVWVIDPIDGTRSFIEGSGTWAHSLAIARNGVITAAAVFLPMRDMFFTASIGQGAYMNGAPISSSAAAGFENSNILATRPSLEEQHWAENTPPVFKRHHRPSLAYRLSLVAKGSFDGMLTLRPSWEWDIAAGALIVSEAGGAITDKTGAPLMFNNTDPRLNGVVAAAPALHSALVSRLA